MGYAEQFKKAKTAKEVKSLSPKYREWKKDGDVIVGRFLAKNSVQGQLGGGNYNQYLFDTDAGLTKFALGRATDNEAGILMGIGGVYAVTYHGQEQLKGGRVINRFDIIEIEPPTETVVGGQGDLPF